MVVPTRIPDFFGKDYTKRPLGSHLSRSARSGSKLSPGRHRIHTMTDYDRIALAIDYIVAHGEAQPGLAELAAAVDLSPWHFQRVFQRWAGVSPKRFLQVVTVERAKRMLVDSRRSLLDASDGLGLSSSSRLHDHFVTLEAVTPDEFRRGGEGIEIRYGESDSRFGRVFVAASARGLIRLAFVEHETPGAALEELEAAWPGARFVEDPDLARDLAARVFETAGNRAGPAATAEQPLCIRVRGTNFQIAVWRALLAIPPGKLVAYGDIARAIGRPSAVRAVGSAIGANPCAFVIPCHRVIRESGEMGGYRWGLTRKHAIQLWEAAVTDGMLPGC